VADYIFQSGSCLKSQLFANIKNILISGGWTDISSNPATDFMVFQSSGESGNQNLVFQLRDTNTSNTNSVSTTDYAQGSIRFISTYTPAGAGQAGTFGRAAEVWKPFPTASYSSTAVSSPSSTINYRYHVNKNRLIIYFEYPIPYAPSFQYIGIPDIQYASEPASKGLLQAGTGLANNTVNVTDAAGEAASQSASVTRTAYFQTTPKNPNSAGKYHLSEVFIGDANEGYRFQLTGIYIAPIAGLINGDTFVIGTKRYIFFTLPAAQVSTHTFISGTNGIVIQIG
jgi:hypothetical protein